MQVRCSHCGKEFEAQRRSAKYCGGSCRGKASHARHAVGGDVVEMRPAKKTKPRRDPVRRSAPDEPPAAAGPEQQLGLVGAIEQQLRTAEKLQTFAGQQALFLAERLQRSLVDSASGVAALSKELDRMMTSIMADVEPEADELDRIQGQVLQMRSRRRA